MEVIYIIATGKVDPILTDGADEMSELRMSTRHRRQKSGSVGGPVAYGTGI